jgi:hypothetical protein
MSAFLVLLYSAGGVFELAGILSVAFDVRDDRRRAEEIAKRAAPRFGGGRLSGQAQSVFTHKINHSKDPLARAIYELEKQRQLTHSKVSEAAWELKHVKQQMLDILSGDLGRRKAGVILLVLGLVVSVGGNIPSVFYGRS